MTKTLDSLDFSLFYNVMGSSTPFWLGFRQRCTPVKYMPESEAVTNHHQTFPFWNTIQICVNLIRSCVNFDIKQQISTTEPVSFIWFSTKCFVWRNSSRIWGPGCSVLDEQFINAHNYPSIAHFSPSYDASVS